MVLLLFDGVTALVWIIGYNLFVSVDYWGVAGSVWWLPANRDTLNGVRLFHTDQKTLTIKAY